MDIKLTLSLPRDALSIPLVRRICTQSLETLGVEPEYVRDLEVALTEACANVLNHSDGDDDYEVSAGIDDNRCVVEVIDRGRGFDFSSLGDEGAPVTAERGRGIQLMRHLVDRVDFVSRPQQGTVVHLEKELRFAERSPMRRLHESRSQPTLWSGHGSAGPPGPLGTPGDEGG